MKTAFDVQCDKVTKKLSKEQRTWFIKGALWYSKYLLNKVERGEYKI